MKKLAIIVMGTFLLGVPHLNLAAQSAGQDVKDAGHEVKNAGKATGRAAKKTGSAVKKTTKKGVNKTAGAVGSGANKIEEKTDDK